MTKKELKSIVFHFANAKVVWTYKGSDIIKGRKYATVYDVSVTTNTGVLTLTTSSSCNISNTLRFIEECDKPF